MCEKIDFKKLKLKVTIEKAKREVCEKAYKTACWVRDNKEWLLPAVTVTAGAVYKGAKMWNTHREDVIRNRRFYDPRRGRYTTARRNLTKRELRTIDERFDKGESYRRILDDMGLI